MHKGYDVYFSSSIDEWMGASLHSGRDYPVCLYDWKVKVNSHSQPGFRLGGGWRSGIVRPQRTEGEADGVKGG